MSEEKTTTTKPRTAAKTAIKTVTAENPAPKSQGDAILTIGRRKSAIANVRVTPGKGSIMVNQKEYKLYFPLPLMQKNIELPLVITNLIGTLDVQARVKGGGFRGQAEALRLGITRALLIINPELRKTLRSEGLVTRDPRVKERKKPGLKRARRAPQFSKR